MQAAASIARSAFCFGTRIVLPSGALPLRFDRETILLGTGAPIHVLQTFPGVVFLCDQTELAVERGVAYAILVKVESKE